MLYSTLPREMFKMAAQAGFQVQYIELKQLFEPRTYTAQADILVQRWLADYPDPDTFMHDLLHSVKGIVGPICGNEELDRLIEKGRIETNPNVRSSIYRQIEEHLKKEVILIPLFHEQTYCFVRPGIEGLELNYFVPTVSYERLSIRR